MEASSRWRFGLGAGSGYGTTMLVIRVPTALSRTPC